MFFQVLISLAVVSAVSATGATGCCAPKQWEGGQSIVTGFAKGADDKDKVTRTYTISYDANATKVAKVGKLKFQDKEIDFKIILDYQINTGYRIHTRTGKCTKYSIRNFRELCMPQSTKPVGGATYFGMGENRLDTQCYEYPTSDGVSNLVALNCVTARGCLPLIEDVVGTYRGAKVFASVNTYALTAGIKDPAIFNPPTNCEKNPFDILGDDFFEKYSLSHPHSDVSWLTLEDPAQEQNLNLRKLIETKIH